MAPLEREEETEGKGREGTTEERKGEQKDGV
jgi:hypothetical protein